MSFNHPAPQNGVYDRSLHHSPRRHPQTNNLHTNSPTTTHHTPAYHNDGFDDDNDEQFMANESFFNNMTFSGDTMNLTTMLATQKKTIKNHLNGHNNNDLVHDHDNIHNLTADLDALLGSDDDDGAVPLQFNPNMTFDGNDTMNMTQLFKQMTPQKKVSENTPSRSIPKMSTKPDTKPTTASSTLQTASLPLQVPKAIKFTGGSSTTFTKAKNAAIISTDPASFYNDSDMDVSQDFTLPQQPPKLPAYIHESLVFDSSMDLSMTPQKAPVVANITTQSGFTVNVSASADILQNNSTNDHNNPAVLPDHSSSDAPRQPNTPSRRNKRRQSTAPIPRLHLLHPPTNLIAISTSTNIPPITHQTPSKPAKLTPATSSANIASQLTPAKKIIIKSPRSRHSLIKSKPPQTEDDFKPDNKASFTPYTHNIDEIDSNDAHITPPHKTRPHGSTFKSTIKNQTKTIENGDEDILHDDQFVSFFSSSQVGEKTHPGDVMTPGDPRGSSSPPQTIDDNGHNHLDHVNLTTTDLHNNTNFSSYTENSYNIDDGLNLHGGDDDTMNDSTHISAQNINNLDMTSASIPSTVPHQAPPSEIDPNSSHLVDTSLFSIAQSMLSDMQFTVLKPQESVHDSTISSFITNASDLSPHSPTHNHEHQPNMTGQFTRFHAPNPQEIMSSLHNLTNFSANAPSEMDFTQIQPAMTALSTTSHIYNTTADTTLMSMNSNINQSHSGPINNDIPPTQQISQKPSSTNPRPKSLTNSDNHTITTTSKLHDTDDDRDDHDDNNTPQPGTNTVINSTNAPPLRSDDMSEYTPTTASRTSNFVIVDQKNPQNPISRPRGVEIKPTFRPSFASTIFPTNNQRYSFGATSIGFTTGHELDDDDDDNDDDDNDDGDDDDNGQIDTSTYHPHHPNLPQQRSSLHSNQPYSTKSGNGPSMNNTSFTAASSSSHINPSNKDFFNKSLNEMMDHSFDSVDATNISITSDFDTLFALPETKQPPPTHLQHVLQTPAGSASSRTPPRASRSSTTPTSTHNNIQNSTQNKRKSMQKTHPQHEDSISHQNKKPKNHTNAIFTPNKGAQAYQPLSPQHYPPQYGSPIINDSNENEIGENTQFLMQLDQQLDQQYNAVNNGLTSDISTSTRDKSLDILDDDVMFAVENTTQLIHRLGGGAEKGRNTSNSAEKGKDNSRNGPDRDEQSESSDNNDDYAVFDLDQTNVLMANNKNQQSAKINNQAQNKNINATSRAKKSRGESLFDLTMSISPPLPTTSSNNGQYKNHDQYNNDRKGIKNKLQPRYSIISSGSLGGDTANINTNIRNPADNLNDVNNRNINVSNQTYDDGDDNSDDNFGYNLFNGQQLQSGEGKKPTRKSTHRTPLAPHQHQPRVMQQPPQHNPAHRKSMHPGPSIARGPAQFKHQLDVSHELSLLAANTTLMAPTQHHGINHSTNIGNFDEDEDDYDDYDDASSHFDLSLSSMGSVHQGGRAGSDTFYTRLHNIQSFIRFAELFQLFDKTSTPQPHRPGLNPAVHRKSRLSQLFSQDDVFTIVADDDDDELINGRQSQLFYNNQISWDQSLDTNILEKQLSMTEFQRTFSIILQSLYDEQEGVLTKIKGEYKDKFTEIEQKINSLAHPNNFNSHQRDQNQQNPPMNTTYSQILKTLRSIPAHQFNTQHPKVQQITTLINNIKNIADYEANCFILESYTSLHNDILAQSVDETEQLGSSLLDMFHQTSENLHFWFQQLEALHGDEMFALEKNIVDNMQSIDEKITSCTSLKHSIESLDEELLSLNDEVAQLQQQLKQLEIGYDVQQQIENEKESISREMKRVQLMSLANNWSLASLALSQHHKNNNGEMNNKNKTEFLIPHLPSMDMFSQHSVGFGNELVATWASQYVEYNLKLYWSPQGRITNCTLTPPITVGGIVNISLDFTPQDASNGLILNPNNTTIPQPATAQQLHHVYVNQHITLLHHLYSSLINDITKSYNDLTLLSSLFSHLNVIFHQINHLAAQLTDITMSHAATVTMGRFEGNEALYVTLSANDEDGLISAQVAIPITLDYKYCDGPLDIQVFYNYTSEASNANDMIEPLDNSNPSTNSDTTCDVEPFLTTNSNSISVDTVQKMINNIPTKNKPIDHQHFFAWLQQELYSYEGQYRLLWIAYNLPRLLNTYPAL